MNAINRLAAKRCDVCQVPQDAACERGIGKHAGMWRDVIEGEVFDFAGESKGYCHAESFESAYTRWLRSPSNADPPPIYPAKITVQRDGVARCQWCIAAAKKAAPKKAKLPSQGSLL